MHRRTALAVLLVLVPTVGASAAVAAQQEPTVDEQQEQVEANRRRQDELASQIGLLEASDVELQAELEDLIGRIAVQERSVVDTEARLGAVRQRVGRLELEVERAAAQVDAQRDLAVQRAIGAYVNPQPGRFEVLVGTSDLNDIAKKDVLLQEVATHDRDVLVDFEASAAALRLRQQEASAAAEELRQAEAEATAALAELEAARARQEAVREMLEVRISEFRRESDDLAAEEEALQALIADRLRPPPTTAPPTTVAPTTTETTTTGPPGTGPSSTTTSTTSAPTTTSPPDPGYGLAWPLSGPVTSTFGPRWGRMHNGIDVGVPTGTPIAAAASGEVFFSGWMGGYGNVVLIDHLNGLITLYAHQSELAAAEGDTVGRGDLIGYAGSTGNSTGPHLHFETRVDGVPRDPLAYLP